MQGAEVLRRRVLELDAAERPWAESPGAAGLVEHAVSVLAARTGPPGTPAPVDPGTADAIVGRCALLADLRRDRPDLVDGPLRRDAQVWLGTGRHGRPDPAALVVPRADLPPAAKPFGTGLFTSTADAAGRSAWSAYLEPYRGSELFPAPWTAWRLEVAAGTRVHEVDTAAGWAGLVARHPRRHGREVYPDWASIAAEVDGVHLTLRAVAAIQGVPLRTAAGPTAPAYWDVESTFWLRWCFGRVDQV